MPFISADPSPITSLSSLVAPNLHTPSCFRGSMGRVAAADNARMELFHSLPKSNVLNSKKWELKKSFESQSLYGLKEPTTEEGANKSV
jgi:hypothetical protein